MWPSPGRITCCHLVAASTERSLAIRASLPTGPHAQRRRMASLGRWSPPVVSACCEPRRCCGPHRSFRLLRCAPDGVRVWRLVSDCAAYAGLVCSDTGELARWKGVTRWCLAPLDVSRLAAEGCLVILTPHVARARSCLGLRLWCCVVFRARRLR